MDKTDKEVLIKEFLRALHEDNAGVFAGAGLSAASGYVNWRELLRDVAEELGLDVEKEKDLISLAQYFYNKNGRQRLTQLIIDNFAGQARINENHRILASLPIHTYWTTNYDKLIEDALGAAGKNPDVKVKEVDFSVIKPRRDAIVYKMHGDIERANETILIKDEYEMFLETNQLFLTGLKGDLVSKTFLFIGYSFEDPDLEYILSRIRVLMDSDSRIHYCFFRRINRGDYAEGAKGEEEFRYDSIKQELKCADLVRYHIRPILVDEYSDITDVLKVIEERYRRSTVFISGSADTYQDFANDEDAQLFIHKLSREMVKSEFKVASGFGDGVGSGVINGVLDWIYSTINRKTDDYLLLRPFPQYSSTVSLPELWEQYRREFINNVGIAVFIFGNKLSGNEIIPANGVKREFEICIEKGVKVIPVGATGYVSFELWKQVMDNFDDYYPGQPNLRTDFETIGDSREGHDRIIDAVVNIASKLRSGR